MSAFRRLDSNFMGGATAKRIKVFRNGNHSRQAEILLKPGATFQQLRDEIISKLSLRETGIFKLFNNEGIELYEDYIPLLRDEDHIFVSLGEGFDQKTTLAEFKELSLLGQGGFGKVMLVEQETSGQFYAVKYVDARKYGLANLIDMVFKEAELLKNINHKHIVQIVNFFTLKDMRVAFVMEYLKGGELGEFLRKKGRLEEEEAREIFAQLVDAVNFCHNNNIIHRDLKLENILFESTDSNIIKVVDFGIAGFYSNMKGSESSAGSLRYMAPEVLSGRNKAANPSIDVWSMGVILHTLLHGSMPFRGKTRKEIIENIVYGKHQIEPEIKKKISLECQDLLTRMLVVDYKSRITTYEITEHPWIKGEKNVFMPSWYEEDKLDKGFKEEVKKNLLTPRLTQGHRGHVRSKGSLGGYEKEVFKKILEIQEPMHKKSSSKDQASLSSLKETRTLKEKKSLMYEESKRREKKLHTIDVIGKEEVVSPIISPLGRGTKEKKLTFPMIPHTTTNASKPVNKFGKKNGFF